MAAGSKRVADNAADEAPKKVKRGGIHLRVAETIEKHFSEGTFDPEPYLGWLQSQTYEPPSNTDRNATASEFKDAFDDTDVLESLLYTERGYKYVLWNRNVRVCGIGEHRCAIFAEHAMQMQAGEGDDDGGAGSSA